MSEIRITGIGVSEGIRFGQTYFYAAAASGEEAYRESIAEHEREAELERLEAAKRAAMEDLRRIIDKAEQTLGKEKSMILQGQQSFLNDPAFYGEIRNAVSKRLCSPEKAVKQVVAQLAELFEKMNNAYVKERIHDIRDVADRLMSHLRQEAYPDLMQIREPVILVADDLTPSVTAQLDRNYILGFVTRLGGETTHTAILSRSLGIPAVVGTGDAFGRLRHGQSVILDGGEGCCIIHPEAETVEAYKRKQEKEQERAAMLERFKRKPARTADGARVELAVNIGTPEEVRDETVEEAEGVGLFRTEFLFMNADRFPDEEIQFQAYKRVVERWQGKPVVIRTLDIGGDKELSYWNLPKESNPFLGMRAVRLCLHERELFKTQLRAILRASAYGNAKIMFPMVSSMQEFRQAKAIAEEVKRELAEKEVAFNEAIEIGIMAEVPSVIQMADRFAKEVDFFSIGTNDLVQYTLAVDRMNEKVAHLYDYFHPAVLRSIQSLIAAAHRERKWVGMCGKMAGDPLAAPLLLAMGLDEWSMDAASLVKQKHALARLSLAECKELLAEIIDMDTADEVRSRMAAFREEKSKAFADVQA